MREKTAGPKGWAMPGPPAAENGGQRGVCPDAALPDGLVSLVPLIEPVVRPEEPLVLLPLVEPVVLPALAEPAVPDGLVVPVPVAEPPVQLLVLRAVSELEVPDGFVVPVALVDPPVQPVEPVVLPVLPELEAPDGVVVPEPLIEPPALPEPCVPEVEARLREDEPCPRWRWRVAEALLLPGDELAAPWAEPAPGEDPEPVVPREVVVD